MNAYILNAKKEKFKYSKLKIAKPTRNLEIDGR